MQQITLTETQNKVMEEWNKTKRGVIQLPTAFGKTIIALEILKNPEYKMICITTNTLHLIEQWKQELQKNDLLKNRVVVVQTIQSLYKLKNQEFDILIWDEGHRSISNKWWDFIKNNKFKYILILTATLQRDDKRHLLLKELNINVIADNSYNKGIQEKLVSDFLIINKSINLNQNEQETYERINDFIRNNYSKFNYDFYEVKKQIFRNSTAQELFSCFQKRKEILNNAHNKIDETYNILQTEKFTKAIVFCEYIPFAEKIYNFLKFNNLEVCLYHSQQKNRQKILENFKDNYYNVIIAVHCLDEGINIPEADLGIIVSASSQQRQSVQRTGRLLRYQEGKTAKIYNLYCINTKEEEWVKERIKNFDKNKIYWR